jgi:ankyrin repeat protein
MDVATQQTNSDSEKRANTGKLLDVIGADAPTRVTQIKQLLRLPIDLDYFDPEYKATPLIAAIAKKQLDTALLLLQAGATTRTDPSQPSPLGCVAAYGHTEFVEPLLQFGAPLDGIDATGCTPLAIAAEQDRVLCLLELLKHGAKTDFIYPDGLTLLGKAAQNGLIRIGKALLQSRVNVHALDEHEYTALKYAAGNGHIDFAKLLLSFNADIRNRNKRGSTIAHVCAFHGRVKMLELISQHFPEALSAEDYVGRTPFFWAAIQGKMDVISFLLDKDINVNTTFIDGSTLFTWLQSDPKYAPIYKLCKSKKKAPTQKTTTKKKTKKKASGKTYNQRRDIKPEESPLQVIKTEPQLTMPKEKKTSHQERANELNNLLVGSSDGSYVILDDGQTIIFGYKHLREQQTDLIYRLRGVHISGGPRLIYHSRVADKRKGFLEGARDEDTILHTQPEALERMHGHAFLIRYTDSKGRSILNKILLGKKLINNQWVEGMYMLGFTNMQGELTCYHSFFKQQPFHVSLAQLDETIAAADKELFMNILERINK